MWTPPMINGIFSVLISLQKTLCAYMIRPRTVKGAAQHGGTEARPPWCKPGLHPWRAGWPWPKYFISEPGFHLQNGIHNIPHFTGSLGRDEIIHVFVCTMPKLLILLFLFLLLLLKLNRRLFPQVDRFKYDQQAEDKQLLFLPKGGQ